MSSYCSTAKPKRRRRRKQRDRPCLDFVESPIETFAEPVDHVTGEPIEFPTITLDTQSSTQWVSPQIRKSERLRLKRGRTRTRLARVKSADDTQKLTVDQTGDFSTILEYDEDPECNRKRNTSQFYKLSRRSTSKQLCTPTLPPKNSSSSFRNNEEEKEEEDNSPAIPSCLSTPKMSFEESRRQLLSRSSASPSTSTKPLHYLFQASTPVVSRDVVVLVENTPF